MWFATSLFQHASTRKSRTKGITKPRNSYLATIFESSGTSMHLPLEWRKPTVCELLQQVEHSNIPFPCCCCLFVRLNQPWACDSLRSPSYTLQRHPYLNPGRSNNPRFRRSFIRRDSSEGGVFSTMICSIKESSSFLNTLPDMCSTPICCQFHGVSRPT